MTLTLENHLELVSPLQNMIAEMLLQKGKEL